MATFPLKKTNISFNVSKTDFLNDYTNYTEIPLSPHPGSFGIKRKNHIHEGVDLYCNLNDEVIAIEDGVIVNVFPFTGESCNSPWWNNTWAVMIEGETGVFNYGEILPIEGLKVGQTIVEGQTIGHVLQVLTKNKGRPMNMLHLELYAHFTKNAISEWSSHSPKPKQLLDPTDVLINIMNLQKKNNLKM